MCSFFRTSPEESKRAGSIPLRADLFRHHTPVRGLFGAYALKDQ